MPNGSMNTVIMVAEMSVIHEIDSIDCHSLRLILLKLLLSYRSANSRDQHCALDMSPFPGVTRQQPGGRLTALNHFLPRKNKALSLLE